MNQVVIKKITEIAVAELIASDSVIIGLDVGDKTVGIAVSDRRIRIASGITTISRNGSGNDFLLLLDAVKSYKIGLVVFGWPLQMNGLPGEQCKKVMEFIEQLHEYLPTNYTKWDERLSTRAVDNLMIKADMSRKKRQKSIDKGAATYILQGALDCLNR